MTSISDLAKRQAELVAELETVRAEIAARHGETETPIETTTEDTNNVETTSLKHVK